jgi:ribosome-binding protein aMBF1 (putative translation factor)
VCALPLAGRRLWPTERSRSSPGCAMTRMVGLSSLVLEADNQRSVVFPSCALAHPRRGTTDVSHTGARLLDASERAALTRAFGERVRDHRDRAGLSQEELASRCGVRVSTISNTERGGNEPRLSLILILVRAFASHLMR